MCICTCHIICLEKIRLFFLFFLALNYLWIPIRWMKWVKCVRCECDCDFNCKTCMPTMNATIKWTTLARRHSMTAATRAHIQTHLPRSSKQDSERQLTYRKWNAFSKRYNHRHTIDNNNFCFYSHHRVMHVIGSLWLSQWQFIDMENT